MADTYLSVVDGDDQVLGRQLRSVIHQQGLRHREVHIWFVTKKGELILQRRSATKEIYPNMLDASVSGHVEEAQDYKAAALAEAMEETGLELMKADLVPLAKIDITQIANGIINVVYRMIYLHKFAGSLEDLKVEAGDGAGFVAVPIADILNRKGPMMAQMIPGLLEDAYAPAWQAMRDVLRV